MKLKSLVGSAVFDKRDSIPAAKTRPPYSLKYYDRYGDCMEIGFKQHQTRDEVIHVARVVLRQQIAKQVMVLDAKGQMTYSDYRD